MFRAVLKYVMYSKIVFSSTDIQGLGNHGEEAFIYGGAAYGGTSKREESANKPELSHQTLKRRQSIKKLPDSQHTGEIAFREKEKSRIRAKAELPFHIIKNLFKFRKTPYQGLAIIRVNNNSIAFLPRF